MIGRTFSWWLACWRQAISRDLQFRTQTILIALGAVVDVAISLVPALVLAQSARTAESGWDESTAVLVVGLFTLTTAVLDTVVGPNLLRLDAAVRTGELDLLLIRPIPAVVTLTLRWIRPAEATRLLVGAALVLGALSMVGGAVSLGGVLGCLLLMALGTGAWTLFWINASFLSFWWASVEPVQEVIGALREAGQYPRAAFDRLPLLGFTTLVPALLMATLPAQVLLGGELGGPLLGGVVVVGAGGLVTALHWRLAIRRYDSASS
ncbi:ABC-2 family transporter protein [Brachybacterium huguangmaarense]|uniref:ABC-2 family transporter protein n=1 Tax=Brachybacterium huguangmaarense TaxID=1652028 RepID=A0ABY6G0L4_9MICO|nr:ABC-2 family transporter protein [Brachybacterium huguangmaarense]UYG16739.1 ABC-2 family transporter protein [Brachybacterium huguangmaarense]